MKKLNCLLLLMAFGIYSYAQQIPVDTVKNKQYYLEKRSSQRTTGWIFFGLGAGAIIAGAIVYSSQPILSSDKDNTGGVIMAVGAVGMLVSIPFFIASHQSNLKAMQLSVGPKLERNDPLIQMYAGKYQPAVSLKMNFR
jgi:hypothetical protein